MGARATGRHFGKLSRKCSTRQGRARFAQGSKALLRWPTGRGLPRGDSKWLVGWGARKNVAPLTTPRGGDCAQAGPMTPQAVRHLRQQAHGSTGGQNPPTVTRAKCQGNGFLPWIATAPPLT